jgi:hypothetical protein
MDEPVQHRDIPGPRLDRALIRDVTGIVHEHRLRGRQRSLVLEAAVGALTAHRHDGQPAAATRALYTRSRDQTLPGNVVLALRAAAERFLRDRTVHR